MGSSVKRGIAVLASPFVAMLISYCLVTMADVLFDEASARQAGAPIAAILSVFLIAYNGTSELWD